MVDFSQGFCRSPGWFWQFPRKPWLTQFGNHWYTGLQPRSVQSHSSNDPSYNWISNITELFLSQKEKLCLGKLYCPYSLTVSCISISSTVWRLLCPCPESTMLCELNFSSQPELDELYCCGVLWKQWCEAILYNSHTDLSDICLMVIVNVMVTWAEGGAIG